MWSTKHLLAAALLIGVAACGGTDEASSPPAYLPDSVRAQQEREKVQAQRLNTDLTEVEWRLQAIAGASVLPDSQPAIVFAPDGSVSGTTGCNQFNGAWSIDRNQIEFGELATTRMLCPEPLMAQEQAILEVLDHAVLVGIGDEGTLFITTLEGALMTALPAGT